MKIRIFPIISTLLFAALMFSFLSGPANRGHDKTGSPLSNGSCFNCHSSGSFSPSLSIRLLENSQEVDKYEPGKSYQLLLELSTSGTPSAYGFQTVALDENDQNAGSFGNIPSGFQQIDLGGASYVEHSSPRPNNSLIVDWTAPSENAGKITFYAGSIAANNNGGTSGDGGTVTAFAIEPNTSSIESLAAASKHHLYLINTLVNNSLKVECREGAASFDYYILNQQGKMILSGHHAKSMNPYFEIATGDLAEGMYFLSTLSNGERSTQRFYKI